MNLKTKLINILNEDPKTPEYLYSNDLKHYSLSCIKSCLKCLENDEVIAESHLINSDSGYCVSLGYYKSITPELKPIY